MKKTVITFCGILVMTLTAMAQEGERVRFDSGSMLLSHPHYMTAEMKQDSLIQDINLKFTAIPKQKNWAYVLVKLEAPLDTEVVGVKITYKAVLATGIKLSMGLEEDDEVTYEYKWDCDTPGVFRTVVVPLDKFVVGAWCRKPDKNQHLDIEKVKTVLIGASGDWKENGGDNQCDITIKDIVFIRQLPLKP